MICWMNDTENVEQWRFWMQQLEVGALGKSGFDGWMEFETEFHSELSQLGPY